MRARGGARRRTQPGGARKIPREAAHAPARGARNAALHELAVHPEPHRPDSNSAACDRLRVRGRTRVHRAGRTAAAAAALRPEAALASQVPQRSAHRMAARRGRVAVQRRAGRMAQVNAAEWPANGVRTHDPRKHETMAGYPRRRRRPHSMERLDG
ncbi:hypothetical protein BLAT2472_50159 [Burkholderia latens]